jgi:putative transposase
MSKSILVHMTFSPKYRRPILERPEVKDMVESLLHQIADMKRIQIEALAIQPDHVHVMAYLPPSMSVAKAAMLLKWFTSFNIRHYLVGRYPSPKAFWASNYFAVSVGGGEANQRAYITRQMESLS